MRIRSDLVVTSSRFYETSSVCLLYGSDEESQFTVNALNTFKEFQIFRELFVRQLQEEI